MGDCMTHQKQKLSVSNRKIQFNRFVSDRPGGSRGDGLPSGLLRHAASPNT